VNVWIPDWSGIQITVLILNIWYSSHGLDTELVIKWQKTIWTKWRLNHLISGLEIVRFTAVHCTYFCPTFRPNFDARTTDSNLNSWKNKTGTCLGYDMNTVEIWIQSESDNRTSSFIKPSILPITGLAIGIRYPDSDIGLYKVAVFGQISRFYGYRASGYQGLTVLESEYQKQLKSGKIAGQNSNGLTIWNPDKLT
jgi:hypothetical protein